jgi:hypothetical protein
MLTITTKKQAAANARIGQPPVRPTAWDRWTVPWELAALTFPLAAVLFAAAGFLVGLPVARWQGVCGLATSVLLCIPGRNSAGNKLRKIAFVLGMNAAAVALAGLSVMYTNPDAEIYHRPASMLMAEGWNPVFDSTPEIVARFQVPNQRLNILHVTFLPRMSWIFGAVLYRIVGFVEAADALNVLTFFLSFFMISRLLARVLDLSGWVRHATAALLVVSPWVPMLMFGGMCDSSFYSLFFIATSAATLYLGSGRTKWLGFVVATFPLIANLKFMGVVSCGVIAVVYLLGCLLAWRSGRAGPALAGRWLLAVATSVGLAAVIGFSPYVTSWVRYGGPFYPAHTFDKRVPTSNSITKDFLWMNEDAKRMGYLGRFGYAYVSQSLTLSLYGKGSDGGRFSPRFDVGGGVGGLGPFFRFAFVLSIVLLPFARVGRLGFLLACILLTVILQPTMYVGYPRYVPQFYAFPLLVFMSAARNFCGELRLCRPTDARIRRLAEWLPPATVATSAAFYSLPLLAYPLSFFALQWVISVQNFEIIKAMQKDPAPLVLTRTYYTHHTLEDDYGCRSITHLPGMDDPRVAGHHRYGPYFASDAFSYSYFSREPLENFPNLSHEVSGNDPSIIASRNRRNMEFFLFSFLPRQLVRLPTYLFDVALLRCRQLGHAWWTTDAACKGGCE